MNQLNEIKGIDIPLVVKLTELFKITQTKVLSFPKTIRYSLGSRILDNNLEILELVFKTAIATKYEKEKILLSAQSKNELLKILIRISLQNNHIDHKEYLQMQSYLNEIGKMLSGWQKFIRNK